MNQASIVLGSADWMTLLGHYMLLSLLCIGGAITTAPDMHRFLVQEHGWLTDPQFSASIALAQAAPGPNVLFAGLMGWNVGLNAGGLTTALLGAFVCLGGLMLPSSVLAYATAKWSHRNRDLRAVRAFKQGMAPIVIGLLISTGWILATANGYATSNWPTWTVTAAAALLVWRTRLHLLWLLGAGALIGWVGFV